MLPKCLSSNSLGKMSMTGHAKLEKVEAESTLTQWYKEVEKIFNKNWTFPKRQHNHELHKVPSKNWVYLIDSSKPSSPYLIAGMKTICCPF